MNRLDMASWEAVGLNRSEVGTIITIQLKFKDPTMISPNFERDYLVIALKQVKHAVTFNSSKG